MNSATEAKITVESKITVSRANKNFVSLTASKILRLGKKCKQVCFLLSAFCIFVKTMYIIDE